MTNIYNLFKFLEKKRGTKTPLKMKFIYTPDELTDEDLKVKGNLDLLNTKITSLPDNLQVGDSLFLDNTPITSLPDNLQVGDSLFLANTPITSLPDNLKVGGYLYLSDTPLAEKYTKDEIRKMIEDKGGYVKGKIYA
jgi:hypothetical protein